MRSRVTRDAFWTDSRLGRASRDARLIFLGLWGLMDTAGRLEDDPLRIRVQLCPYDTDLDAHSLLDELQSVGVINRYEVDGARYIAIPETTRWTYFYDKEKLSTIPARSGHGPSTCQASEGQAPSVEPEPEPESESRPARNKNRGVVPDVQVPPDPDTDELDSVPALVGGLAMPADTDLF